MRYAGITPCKDCVLTEFREKATFNLNQIVRRTDWLKWKQMNDVNGKNRMQWYIVVDTTTDKEKRLTEFANILREEGYTTFVRIEPHDAYYEDYEKYFRGM